MLFRLESFPDFRGITSDQRSHGGLFGRFGGGASSELTHRLPPTNEDRGSNRRPIRALVPWPSNPLKE